MAVIPAGPIISLQDAKDQLNITTPDYDAELQGFVDAANQMVANRIGPVVGAATVDEWHDGGSVSIVVRANGPIQSVTKVTESYGPISYELTEVTEDASPVGAFTYTVDMNRGVLTRRYSGVAGRFAPGRANVHVVYVAGYNTAPADIALATKLLVEHMWQTQRGGAVRPGASSHEDPRYFYTMPRRVTEILAQYDVPGIA